MKRWLLVPAMLAVLPLVSCSAGGDGANTPAAATTAANAPAEDVPATITMLEQQWVAAILDRDTQTLERLIAPDFIGTTDDLRYTKTEALDDVTSGTHTALEMTDLQVHVYGGSTAVTTFDQTEKSMHGAQDFSGHYLFTNVWVKQNGAWQAVASHGARIR